jgi:hypothetical protein
MPQYKRIVVERPAPAEAKARRLARKKEFARQRQQHIKIKIAHDPQAEADAFKLYGFKQPTKEFSFSMKPYTGQTVRGSLKYDPGMKDIEVPGIGVSHPEEGLEKIHSRVKGTVLTPGHIRAGLERLTKQFPKATKVRGVRSTGSHARWVTDPRGVKLYKTLTSQEFDLSKVTDRLRKTAAKRLKGRRTGGALGLALAVGNLLSSPYE